MKLKWFGWASWLIEVDRKKIYIDPFKGESSEKADIVLVSHNHPDHCDVRRLKGIVGENTIVLTPSIFAKDIDAESLDIGQSREIDGIKITGVAAYNLNIPNHQKGVDTGFLIEAEGKKVYFAADTDLIEDMNMLNGIDIALLPIGGTYTMDIDAAVKAVEIIKPKIVIPMHYGVIDAFFGEKPMHIELKADPDEFKEKVGELAEVKILKEGEETEV